MKEYRNPEYKTGKSKIKSFYTSNNVETLGSTKSVNTNTSTRNSNVSKIGNSLSKFSSIFHSFSSVGFFKIVLVFLIMVCLIRIANNPTGFNVPTLSSLLDFLSNAPNISNNINWFIQKLTIPDFPWPINWLSWILNQIVDLWSIIVWIGTSLWSVIEFILYIVIWLFVF